MEALIKELETLRAKPEVPNTRLVTAMIATAVRFKEVLDARLIGIQALATATAMQPGIDALQLHDDYMRILQAHYDSPRNVPHELKDIALAIKLAATERK